MTETTDIRIRVNAARMVEAPRGVLAADESIGTMSSRLEGVGVEATEENRRAYRQLLLTAPDLNDSVSGIIWCDETFRQKLDTGETFPEAAERLGILAGIKVDTGTRPHPGAPAATVTQGLDGLVKRMSEYARLGAGFAKWRAVIDIADPNDAAMQENARALAAYAAVCQAFEIVPIVEPEVLCSGDHSLDDCQRITERMLGYVFDELAAKTVDVSGIVLKPNMITPGTSAPGQAAPDVVAQTTIETLLATVPEDVPGIAFLSGGYSNADACAYLSTMNESAEQLPWALTYSFGRALVSDALATWAGVSSNLDAAQNILLANCGRAAAATASWGPTAA